MLNIQNEALEETLELCDICLDSIKNKCTLKADTLPENCVLIRYYLEMAKKELAPGYQVFVKFTEIYCLFYLVQNDIVVAEYNNPKALIGEILLRNSHPEWFIKG